MKLFKLMIALIILCGCTNNTSTTPVDDKPDFYKKEKPYITNVKDTEDKIVTCLNPFNSNNTYTVIITKEKESKSEECNGRVVLYENDQEIASQNYAINFGAEINYEDYDINWSTQECMVELYDENTDKKIIKMNIDGSIKGV